MRWNLMMLMTAALVLFGGQALAAGDGGRAGDVELAVLEAITPEATAPDTRTKVVLMCFKTGERVSGMNRICYYDCAGSEAAITVGVAELCPLSINR